VSDVPLVTLRALRLLTQADSSQSLSKAAARLNLSLSAATRLAHGLEEAVGVPLLYKQGRALRLTRNGHLLAEHAARGLAEIDAGLRLVREPAPSRPLRLSALPSFALRWLMPRLPDFEALHPGTAVRLASDFHVVDFAAEEADAAVRHGAGDWPGVAARHLFAEELVAVASPRLAAGLTHAEPAAWPLVTTHRRPADWTAWFRATGRGVEAPAPAAVCEHQAGAIAAVIAGLGVGLLDRRLLAPELAGGALVRLDPRPLANGKGYWFVRPAGEPSDAVARFETWITLQARAAETDAQERER